MVPTLLLPPPSKKPENRAISHVTHQWLHAYDMGKRIFPSIVASSALAFTYLAYAQRTRPDKFPRLYLAAAAMSLAIVPYTLGVMMPTNNRLRSRARRGVRAGYESAQAAEGKEGPLSVSEEEKVKMEREDEEIPGLMVKWAWMNAVRGVFPLMGAAFGVTAALR